MAFITEFNEFVSKGKVMDIAIGVVRLSKNYFIDSNACRYAAPWEYVLAE